MIKTFLQHKILEICIDTLFSNLSSNFSTQKITPSVSGCAYLVAGTYYFVDDATGDEYFYDEGTWIDAEDVTKSFKDDYLYNLMLDLDLDDTLVYADEELYSFS